MKERYEKELRPALMEQFHYDNVMQVPKLEKIVINMGVGEAVADSKKVDVAANDSVSTIDIYGRLRLNIRSCCQTLPRLPGTEPATKTLIGI